MENAQSNLRLHRVPFNRLIDTRRVIKNHGERYQQELAGLIEASNFQFLLKQILRILQIVLFSRHLSFGFPSKKMFCYVYLVFPVLIVANMKQPLNQTRKETSRAGDSLKIRVITLKSNGAEDMEPR